MAAHIYEYTKKKTLNCTLNFLKYLLTDLFYLAVPGLS